MVLHDSIGSVRRSTGIYTYCPVIIIGAGASGLAIGCRLKERYGGFDQFRIVDRQSGIGGVWWSNRYPGVTCDIPTVSYSFSFQPNYTSGKVYPGGSEFVQYLHSVTEKQRIVYNIQLNTDITEIRYIEEDMEWELSAAHLVHGVGDLSSEERQERLREKGEASIYLRQEKIRTKIVFSCLGILVEPNPWPGDIPGLDIFRGEIMHSSRWRDIDIRNKDVVVIGSGSSSAQIVPAIIKKPYDASSVLQIMRTPPWVMPRINEPFGRKAYSRWTPLVLGYCPLVGWLMRVSINILAEAMWHSLFILDRVKWRTMVEQSVLDRPERI